MTSKPQPIAVTWFIFAPIRYSSPRLQGYLIHEYLRAHGVESQLLLAPPIRLNELPWSDKSLEVIADSITTPIVIFQKIKDQQADALLERLKARGISTVYVQCDYKPHQRMQWQCDYVLTPSPVLMDMFREKGLPTFPIIDPIEYLISPEELAQRCQTPRKAAPIRLIWVGHSANWSALDTLRDVLRHERFRDFTLITISDHPDTDIRWSLQTVEQHIREGDIGVVPTSEGTLFEAKSPNRATLFMGLGLPVITGDIPAYRAIIQHGESGFIATTHAEWEAALDALRDPDMRCKIAQHAYQTVVPQFTMEKAGEAWMSALSEITAQTNACTPEDIPPRWKTMVRIRAEENIFYAEYALSKHDNRMILYMLPRILPFFPLAPKHILILYGRLMSKLFQYAAKQIGLKFKWS